MNNDLERVAEFLNSLKDGKNMKYILPTLAKFNVKTVGVSRVQNSYLDKTLTNVYIEFKKLPLRLRHDVELYSSFEFSFEAGDHHYFKFKIEEEFRDATKLIVEGRLTEIPMTIKREIYRCSGLAYNRQGPSGFTDSDVSLQVFDKDSPLRRHLAMYFGVKAKDLPDEIVSKIEPDSLLYIENVL